MSRPKEAELPVFRNITGIDPLNVTQGLIEQRYAAWGWLGKFEHTFSRAKKGISFHCRDVQGLTLEPTAHLLLKEEESEPSGIYEL